MANGRRASELILCPRMRWLCHCCLFALAACAHGDRASLTTLVVAQGGDPGALNPAVTRIEAHEAPNAGRGNESRIEDSCCVRPITPCARLREGSPVSRESRGQGTQ